LLKYIDSFTRETEDGENFIIITEYCKGGDLNEFVKAYGGKQENLSLYLKIINCIL